MSQNQNTNNNQNQNTAQQTSVAQQTGAQNTASRAANATITAAPTGGNNTANATTSSVSIPSDAADGWIDMVQPPQIGSSSYYKIAPSEYITFKWNMTSVLSMPQSLTIIAHMGANGNTYPVGPTNSPYNTISGNSTQVVWNPYQWAQMPNQPNFEQGTYTLSIWDQRGPTALPQAGMLSTYSRLQFGMYTPAAYTPFANWTCGTCSSAMETMKSPASLSIFVSLLIVLISMFGMLRREL